MTFLFHSKRMIATCTIFFRGSFQRVYHWNNKQNNNNTDHLTMFIWVSHPSIGPSTYTFNEYKHMPGPVLGIKNTLVSKTDKGPALIELIVMCVAEGNIDFNPEPQINLNSYSGLCRKEG